MNDFQSEQIKQRPLLRREVLDPQPGSGVEDDRGPQRPVRALRVVVELDLVEVERELLDQPGRARRDLVGADNDVVQVQLDEILLGLAALADMYTNRFSPKADGAGWAIVLWQLGDVEAFRKHLHVDELLANLSESALDSIEDELSRYAHAMAA